MMQRNGMNPSPKVAAGQQYWPQADGTLTVDNVNAPGGPGMSIDSRTPPALRGGAPEDISAKTVRAQNKAVSESVGRATVRRRGMVARDT